MIMFTRVRNSRFSKSVHLIDTHGKGIDFFKLAVGDISFSYDFIVFQIKMLRSRLEKRRGHGALVERLTASSVMHASRARTPLKRACFFSVVVVVVVNHCFTSLFGTKGILSDIIIR